MHVCVRASGLRMRACMLGMYACLLCAHVYVHACNTMHVRNVMYLCHCGVLWLGLVWFDVLGCDGTWCIHVRNARMQFSVCVCVCVCVRVL